MSIPISSILDNGMPDPIGILFSMGRSVGLDILVFLFSIFLISVPKFTFPVYFSAVFLSTY